MPRKDLFLPNPQSEKLLSAIIALLDKLNNMPATSSLSIPFKSGIEEFYSLYEEFQANLIGKSGAQVSCVKGCSVCCNHWVEDVNSFEAAIISEHIQTRFAAEIPSILKKASLDVAEMDRIELLMSDKLTACGSEEDITGIDRTDLLLSVYYQLRRPCPLLDKTGCCMIYQVRPFTCRMYISLEEPFYCDPDYINDDVIPTCLIDLAEHANELLDTLHFKYVRFPGDTGLRSLLLSYLKA